MKTDVPFVSVFIWNLSGHPQLTPHLRGPHETVWVHWPKLGVALLHSMKKIEASQ